MAAPTKLFELVERFDRNRDEYKSGRFNEARVRVEFIDPLMSLLGWDLHNHQGHSEHYREVIHEDRVKVGSGTKAPDYGFYTGGERKFFLEAKKPSVDIAGDVAPAVQLRRYAWSAKLPLSILTDFEEFAVYDCRFEPTKDDKPDTARLDFFTYDQLAERWDEIVALFSREAVLNGSLDEYAEEAKRKRGTRTVDDAFLREIEGWRSSLAHDLAARNDLNQRQLNYAVQMNIDRIIFLRMAEDRGVEEYGKLLRVAENSGVYERLCNVFREADDRYNSGLFHFQSERSREEEPDRLTLGLGIDDELLRSIIRSLYYPDSSYEFSVLPVDVLGQVYEQFLGSVIRLDGGDGAIVEQKPEVRKAGGVYYTPTYIVDYIVENTVGKLLEGKKPGPRGGASRLKIVDPACGSGSFLIGAYRYLLDWHRDRYLENGPEKHTMELYQGSGGQWHLTIDEKKRILLNNIYGVDIDPQAVEVTKLSLLLKVLEGETEASIDRQLALIQERALPNLDSNIKCGNSLIGPQFYEQQDLTLFADDDFYRINVFNWEEAFPQAFDSKDPGFDAVIGNPPYIRIQTLKEFAPLEVEHYKKAYQTAAKGNYDIYVTFVEQGLTLLNNSGHLGYIMPQKFCQVQYGKALRSQLSENRNVEKFVGFTNNQVFASAFVNTCIPILSKSPNDDFQYVELQKAKEIGSLPQALQNASASVLPSRYLSEEPWVLKPAKTMTLLEKMADLGSPLEDHTQRIFQGLKTSADKIYALQVIRETSSSLVAQSPQLGREVELEKALCHRLIKGTEMRPFVPLPTERIILFPYVHTGDSAELIEENRLKDQFPKAYAYLKANEAYLRGRESGHMDHSRWYEYGRTQALDVMPLPKIITPDLAPRSSFLVDGKGDLFFLGGAAGGYGLLPESHVNPLYLAGVLNSQAISFFITASGQQMESGYHSFEARFIRTTPIRNIDFSDSEDRTLHDQIVGLVKQRVTLNRRLEEAKIAQETAIVQQQIAATDRQIDRLVYELYELTDEEIAVVEEATPR